MTGEHEATRPRPTVPEGRPDAPSGPAAPPPVDTQEPAAPPPADPPGARAKRRGRPVFGTVVVAVVVARLGREVVELVARSQFGILGVVLAGAAGLALVLLWRLVHLLRVRARDGTEFTTDVVARQIAESGVGPPAFEEDGTLVGASVLAVNQHSKILEVETTYAVFGSAGSPLGSVRQIGQSRGKQVARILTGFDQFFTHHFDVLDIDGHVVLRLTRPRKVFLTKLHVYDGADTYLGTIRQLNVFWKIRFAIVDAAGVVVGHLRAENVRAWDFHVDDVAGRNLATVVKSWEGWGRTAFTRADHYVVRIHVPLAAPMRQLTLAAALATDLALKQDARGLG